MEDGSLRSKEWEIVRGRSRLVLRGPLIAAPMASAIDPPYRQLLHENGCQLSFSEMISARGLYERSDRTMMLAGRPPGQGYSGAQIFGSDPKYISKGAQVLKEQGHDLIDLNAGCPKQKVMAQGSGGALLKDLEKLLNCLTSLAGSVPVPVGIKMRSGYKSFDRAPFVSLLQDIASAGACYIAIHPRTVAQGFKGKADRSVIDLAASCTELPIIASGDVKGPTDVRDYLERGAKGVMVGRVLLGDPGWLGRCMASLGGEEWGRFPREPGDVRDLLSLARRHLELACGFYGERQGCKEFRPHLSWYISRFKGRSSFRDRVFSISTKGAALTLIDEVEGDWTANLHASGLD